MTETESLAYCAGLVDGEGSICINKHAVVRNRKSPYYESIIRVGMTTYPSVAFIYNVLGGGIRREPKPKPSGKPWWVWSVWTEAAKKVAQRLLPYLVLKREQAELLIALQEHVAPFRYIGPKRLSQEELAIRESFYLKMQDLHA